MNYSDTLRLLSIINRLLACRDSNELHDCIHRVIAYKSRFRKTLASYIATDFNWGPTRSELRFLTSLEQIAAVSEPATPQALLKIAQIEHTLSADSKMIKVVFFVQEYSVWASFKSIFDFFARQDNIQITLVFLAGTAESLAYGMRFDEIEKYLKAGYAVTMYDDYDLAKESPDMAFYLKPYRGSNGAPLKYYISEVSKHVQFTVFISYCLDVQGGADLQRFFYAQPMFYYAWKIIAYSSHYEKLLKRFSYCDGANIVRFGHPKFDGVAQILKGSLNLSKPDWDSIINDRPVILWNTHFSTMPNSGVGTFLQNKDYIFDFFSHHPEYVLLWRPHPYFWANFNENNGYGLGTSSMLKQSLSQFDNIILDDDGDYRYAFAYSDALISDATTFLIEYGMTGKPVLYTPKTNGESVIDESYLAGLDICKSPEDIESFIHRACNRKSAELGSNRQMEQEFGICDGRNGERIGQYVLNAMEEALKSFAESI